MSNVRELARNMIATAVNNKLDRALIEKIERVCFNDALALCRSKTRDISWNYREFVEEYTYQVTKLTSIINEDHVREIEVDDIYGAVRWILMSPQKPKSITTESRDAFKKQLTALLYKYNVNISDITCYASSNKSDNPDNISKYIVNVAADVTPVDKWVNILENNCYQKCIDAAHKERYCTEFDIECMHLYHNLTIKILNNIDPESTIGSRHLIDQINTGIITCDNLVNLTESKSYMLAPKHSEEIREYLNTQSQQKIEVKTSSYFVCPKCHERKTTYYEKQKRALDEPATIFINCVSCGFNWAK